MHRPISIASSWNNNGEINPTSFWYRIVCGVFILALAGSAALGVEEEPPPVLDQVDAYIAAQSEAGSIDREQAQWKRRLPIFPTVTYRSDRELRAAVKTGQGLVTIRLRPDMAPRHVTNFVYLSRLGFYENVPFQFIVPGRRVQWGCPVGDGRGNPGYSFAGEGKRGLRHDKPGLLSMATAGPNTDGCILFITLCPMPWMDGKHTVFGEVIAGMDVVTAIGDIGSKLGVPRQTILISDIDIEEREWK